MSSPPLPPKTPEELTKEFLSQVLTQEYGKGGDDGSDIVEAGIAVVSSFRVKEANAGVLSHVVFVDVEYHHNQKKEGNDKSIIDTSSWPTKFVAKFLLSDFPQMEPMFRVESKFYREFVAAVPTEEKFAFDIPRPVYTSHSVIMVEYVNTTTTTTTVDADADTSIKNLKSSYTAVEGCPKELVIPVVSRLGKFHANYLQIKQQQQQKQQDANEKEEEDKLATICKDLASPAGVGSDLPGPAKEALFCAGGDWRDFLRNIPSELLLLSGRQKDDSEDNLKATTSVQDQIQEICQHQLNSRRLRDVHDSIHNHPIQTMIHGDFHVANMIFGQPRKEGNNNNNNNVWLLDWATCGKGFPLIDLAFFSIVSLTTETRRQVEDDMLKAYHEALVGGSSNKDNNKEDDQQESIMPLQELKQLYRLCLLNQFLILVGYDKLSRRVLLKTPQLAKRPQELKHHFDVVNARACYALLDHFEKDGKEEEDTSKQQQQQQQPTKEHRSLVSLLPRHKSVVEKTLDYIFWVPVCRTVLLLAGFQFWMVRRRHRNNSTNNSNSTTPPPSSSSSSSS